MNKEIYIDRTAEDDATIAKESLNYATFNKRFIETDNNTSEPYLKASNGQPLKEYVKDQVNTFKKDAQTVAFDRFRDGVFQKFSDRTFLTIGYNHLYTPVFPAKRDLLHVYGPDRDNIKDWEKYYRYAWSAKGPNGIIHSSDQEIIRQGKLECNSYAYSGQSSYAIVGSGMLFRPQFGDSTVNVRPFVQWLTASSFTGNDLIPASATASLGIYIESWSNSGGGHYVDRDHWIPVWSQNTQSYLVHQTAGGNATGVDGLTTDFLAVAQRKYAIFIYVFLETTASPQQVRNEVRYVTLDIEANVPYVVVEETLI